MSTFCFQCAAYNICKIWPLTMAYSVSDVEYPDQWQRDEDGSVTCTSFVDKRDVQRRPHRCEATADLFEGE